MGMHGKVGMLGSPIDFHKLKNAKEKNKNKDHGLKLLGPAKLGMLSKAGIAFGQELVDHWATEKDVVGAEENKIPALYCLLKSWDERKKEAIVEKWVHAIIEIAIS